MSPLSASVYGWLVACLCLGHTGSQTVEVTSLQRDLEQLANDGLGVNAFQNYLDNEVTFTEAAIDADQVLQRLSTSLGERFQARIKAVTNIRDALVQRYDYLETTRQYQDCCSARLSEKDPRFDAEVDLDTLCGWGEGYRNSNEVTHVDESILAVMKDNLRRTPGLKYQYFGSEEGMIAAYPANRLCSQTYDPRFRPWYVETATPTPKDVVVVIDKSGSMRNTHQGRTLMEIAIEAASTVVSTLNPNDRVGIVAFSTEAATPPGSTRTSTCYSTQLSQATPQNKEYLKSYISTLRDDGGTFYDRAFTSAFRFFDSSPTYPKYDKRRRDKVILFLTDGEPSASDVDYNDVIRDENAKQNNSVIILTFGLGQNLREQAYGLLTNIAEQTSHNPAYGAVTRGTVHRILDPSKLRHEMGDYYNVFSGPANSNRALFAIPYYDAFGLGLITSVCLPVHTAVGASQAFRGVTCVDVTIGDLFKDVTFFQQGRQSYAFILDRLARLMVHPLLPQPYSVEEDPIFLHVPDLEPHNEIHPQLSNMQQGLSGEITIDSRRVISRGDIQHEGVDYETVTSTYSWQSVPGTDFTLCVVIGQDDRQASITWPGTLPPQFVYHRTDLVAEVAKCRYFQRAVLLDSSVVKFAPDAFSDPGLYLDLEETQSDLDRYELYMTRNNADNPGFETHVREEVAVTAKFDDVLSEEDAWHYALWRYVGMKHGVFRLYPGAKLVKPYDHTQRPWYKRGQSQRGRMAFSKPYVDAFSSGIVITLSNALYEGRQGGQHTYDDAIIGVMGMDFTMPLFYAKLRQQVAACRNDANVCFVVDRSGYIVIHPDFLEASAEDRSRFENVHVTVKEPLVASRLIAGNILEKEACINLEDIREQRFWKMRPPVGGVYSDSAFELHEVAGTNVFVVVRTGPGSSSDCYCAANGYSATLR